MCQMDHLGRFLNLNVWLWSTTLWGSWIPSICHPPAHSLAQKLHFAEVHPILGGFHGNWGTGWQVLVLLQLCFWQETAQSLKVWFMVLIVRLKVIKEHRSRLHKPTPFRAVIPVSLTNNSIFCTSLFTILRKPLKHSALPSQFTKQCGSNATNGLPRNTGAPFPQEVHVKLPVWRNLLETESPLIFKRLEEDSPQKC